MTPSVLSFCGGCYPVCTSGGKDSVGFAAKSASDFVADFRNSVSPARPRIVTISNTIRTRGRWPTSCAESQFPGSTTHGPAIRDRPRKPQGQTGGGSRELTRARRFQTLGGQRFRTAGAFEFRALAAADAASTVSDGFCTVTVRPRSPRSRPGSGIRSHCCSLGSTLFPPDLTIGSGAHEE